MSCYQPDKPVSDADIVISNPSPLAVVSVLLLVSHFMTSKFANCYLNLLIAIKSF